MTKDEKKEMLNLALVGKMMEAEKRLDACPFCGNKAKIWEPSYIIEDKYVSVFARCSACGATSKPFHIKLDGVTPERVDAALYNLVELWNTRVKPGERIEIVWETEDDDE